VIGTLERRIADLFPRKQHHYYVRSKLRTDPLYTAIHRELEDTDLPLLDLGCGLGVLAFYLRERGLTFPIHSFDYDEPKIKCAKQAIPGSGFSGLTFAFHDARNGLPDHAGNVTILDILQFFTAEQQETLLQQAATNVPVGGKLVIRSCVRDDSWRFRVTILGDLLAKVTFWMKAAPTHYPSAEDFSRILSPFGKVSISPLWGGTPFNNHLIVLNRQ
jgi:2-polyprenyl-3-methyl-5-hydroxy-6-metoxy-1,4-benzoquinol methylase